MEVPPPPPRGPQMDSPEISILNGLARELVFIYWQMFKKQIFWHGLREQPFWKLSKIIPLKSIFLYVVS